MYAYASPQRAPAPATNAPPARSVAGPSNQDQLARVGLAAEPPACAPTSEATDTLSAMGELGAVVLDAMPLSLALPLALERRALDWARSWLADQSSRDLAGVGMHAALALADAAFPSGTRVTVDAALTAAFLAGVTPGCSCAFARTPTGWSVDLTRSVGASKDLGVGAVLTGAFGAVLGGAKAEAGAGVDLETTCGWDLPDGVVGTSLLGVVDCLRRAVCQDDITALAGVFRVLAPAITRVAPTRTSARGIAKASAQAAAVGLVGAQVNAEVSATGAYGIEGDTAWWESRLGGEAGARAISPLLEAAGAMVPADVLAQADARLGVRVQREGTDEDARWTFTVLRAASTSGSFSEAFEAADARSFVALLTSCIGVRASVAKPGALPDVTLATSVSVESPDAPLSAFSSPIVRTALEVAEAIPDQGFAASIRELRAEATVRVGPEAVAVALAGTPRFTSVTEADVVEVGRAITAHVLGRTYTSDATHDADLEAGVVCADVDAAWLARVRTGVGAGVNGVIEGAEAAAALRASATVEGRAPMTDRADVARTFAS